MTDATISSLTRRVLWATKLRYLKRKELARLAGDEIFFKTEIEKLGNSIPEFHGFTANSETARKTMEACLAEIETAKSLNQKIISVHDKHFPHLLADHPNLPLLLYASGSTEILTSPCVTVIGSRDATDHALVITERIVKELVEAGFTIVSGLALGIDATAHAAAIKAGGKTIAVMPCGLETITPKTNSRLAKEIIESGGALVSEYPYKAVPYPSNFVDRDTTQAAFSSGVVLIQSGTRGGSMHASRAAIEIQRPLIVVEPTKHDAAFNRLKVDANLALINGDAYEKASLLRCDESSLDYLFPLRSKADYPEAFAKLKNVQPKGALPLLRRRRKIEAATTSE